MRSRPTAQDRERVRAEFRRRAVERMERELFQITRSLNCAQGFCGPGQEHPTCMGNQWRSSNDTDIACLCDCHDKEPDQ